MAPYYEADLAQGTLDEAFAQELVGCPVAEILGGGCVDHLRQYGGLFCRV